MAATPPQPNPQVLLSNEMARLKDIVGTGRNRGARARFAQLTKIKGESGFAIYEKIRLILCNKNASFKAQADAAWILLFIVDRSGVPTIA